MNRIERDAVSAFAAPIRARAATFPPLPDDAFAPAVASGHAWVVDQDSAAAGFVAAMPMDDALYILELSVDPARMRRGIGTTLLRHVLRYADGLDVLLTTFRDVSFNAPWYAREGFAAFAPADCHPVLRVRLAEERAHWRDVAERIAMRRPHG